MKLGVYYTFTNAGKYKNTIMVAEIFRKNENYFIEYIGFPSGKWRMRCLTKKAMKETIKKSELKYLGKV